MAGTWNDLVATPAFFFDVLHKAPRLYELLPPRSRQVLSGTCSYLHKWVRERTTCVKLRHSDNLPYIAPDGWPGFAPQDWPNLGVLYESSGFYLDSVRVLHGRWQVNAHLFLEEFCQMCAVPIAAHDDEHVCSEISILVLLISPLGSSRSDLNSRQCEIPSQYANDGERDNIELVIGRERCPLACHEFWTPRASSALHLPANIWSCFGTETGLGVRDMSNQLISTTCAQGFNSVSFPALHSLFLCGSRLSATVCAVLSQASLPSLMALSFSDQGLNAAGLSKLMQASWPLEKLDLANNNLGHLAVAALSKSSWCRRLKSLSLNGNHLGEKGVRALGAGQFEALTTCNLKHCGIGSHAAVTCLAQMHFPELVYLGLTGNPFEAGALACLSVAQWPNLNRLTLGHLDLQYNDWDMFDINKTIIRNKADIIHVCGSGKDKYEQLRDHFDEAKRLRNRQLYKLLCRKQDPAVLPSARSFLIELSYGFCENVTELGCEAKYIN